MFAFFDIGDTLVDEADFARFRHASIFEFLMRRGCRISEAQYQSDLNNLSMQGRMTLFDQLLWLARRNGGDTLLAMAVFRDYILQVAPEAPRRFVPFPDARETLLTLAHPAKGAPLTRLGIIANQPTWIRGRMQDWGLLEFFEADSVVISDEVAISKPRPEIFQFALGQAEVAAADAVMVGNDYLNDILPAKQLGMRTIWIERDDPYAPGAPPILDACAADERVSQLVEVPAALARLADRMQTNQVQANHTNGHKGSRNGRYKAANGARTATRPARL